MNNITPGQKVTICFVNPNGFGMGVSVIEARIHEIGLGNYAQYRNVPHAIFTPKGKRLKRKVQCSYQPYLVVIEGWDHDLKQSVWGDPEDGATEGVQIQRTRHTGHSAAWTEEMNAAIAAKNLKILADFR